MIERKVVVANEKGLHLRSAQMLAMTASKFKSDVHIRKDNMEVDAKSIMGILALSASKGTELVVTANGSDEDAALNAVVSLFESRFDEE